MTDDFDSIFGGRPASRPSFVERTGKAPEPTVDKPEPVVESDRLGADYKAFGFLPTSTIGESCDIQRWVEGTEIPEGIELQYRFLMQIAYTGEEELKLYLPDCIVLITGQNLRDLRKKMARRQVTFVMQYSPKVWPVLPPKGEALVETITVLRPDQTPNRPY